MSTTLASGFRSWLFIFLLSKTSVFSFLLDTKFLVTKAGSFFGQINFSDFNCVIKRGTELDFVENFNASNE